MYVTIGTCSLCGGAVQGPDIWMSILPPPVYCGSCGAKPAEHGPIIPMVPALTQPAIVVTTAGTAICSGDLVVNSGGTSNRLTPYEFDTTEVKKESNV